MTTTPTHQDVLAGLRAAAATDDATHLAERLRATCSRCTDQAQLTRSDRFYCVRHWRIEATS